MRAGQVLLRVESPSARRQLRQALRADARAAAAGRSDSAPVIAGRRRAGRCRRPPRGVRPRAPSRAADHRPGGATPGAVGAAGVAVAVRAARASRRPGRRAARRRPRQPVRRGGRAVVGPAGADPRGRRGRPPRLSRRSSSARPVGRHRVAVAARYLGRDRRQLGTCSTSCRRACRARPASLLGGGGSGPRSTRCSPRGGRSAAASRLLTVTDASDAVPDRAGRRDRRTAGQPGRPGRRRAGRGARRDVRGRR